MKRQLSYTLILSLLLLPTLVGAQGTLFDLISAVQNIVGALVPVVIGVAVLGILIGLAQYAFRAGDEKAQAEGRRIMLWGVITLFVMVSIWGFVAILQNFFFGSSSVINPPDIPTLNESPGGGGGSGQGGTNPATGESGG